MNATWSIPVLAIAAVLALPDRAGAFDLAGAWATNADHCSKIFALKGRASQVNFTNLSRFYGTGFIADASRIKGKFQSCPIKSRKEDGKSVNIVVSCASGIMLSDIQFFMKVVDDNKIVRVFPGMEEKEITYHRCKL